MPRQVSVDVRINQAALNQMLRGPGGTVDADMRKRARRVQRVARQMAPGRMGKKIKAVVVGGHVRIESTHPATMFVVKGTRPHVIRPRYAKTLVFTVRGKRVFTKIVHHPGTRKNDFLSKALRSAV